ncbi:MAG: hypothetical protein LBO69_01395 [Ignavibacteria bacterium]|nr:hypothetical protein [Ignavibacteria bacterium]
MRKLVIVLSLMMGLFFVSSALQPVELQAKKSKVAKYAKRDEIADKLLDKAADVTKKVGKAAKSGATKVKEKVKEKTK